jgi:hypothetical protein
MMGLGVGDEPSNCVTNFMEHHPFSKDDGRSAAQEISMSLEPEYPLHSPEQSVVYRVPTQKGPATVLISCSCNTHCNSLLFTKLPATLMSPSSFIS